MSKTAAVVLAFLCLMLVSTPSRAQLLPSGNVYGGVGIGDNVDVVNRLTFRGWEGSGEVMPFHHIAYLGFVLDGSGFYRTGDKQYNLVIGPRVTKTYGKWRLFAHAMGGIQEATSAGENFHTVIEDFGGGADVKIPFKKNFAWRFQFDYIHSHELSASQNDFRGTTGLVWRF